MKYITCVVALISTNVLSGLNTPFYLPVFSNQLQTINPAFYGQTIRSDGQYNRLEFGVQALYSYQLNDFDFSYDFPIFYSFKSDGFSNSRPSGFRRDANQQMYWINGREVLSKHYSLGYGLTYHNIQLDKYSDGRGLDFGMSLIQHRSGHSAVWSLGFNAKFDFYDYEFENLLDFKSREKANMVNGDVGLAYLSKNRKLKVGLSCFNILNKEISKYESSMTFEGPYTAMNLTYVRQFLLNINKTTFISKDQGISLDYNLLFDFESWDGLYLNDLYLQIGLSKRIKQEGKLSLGLNGSKFITSEFTGPVTGFQIKGNWKHVEVTYNYSFNLRTVGVSTGIHFVGISGRI